jgi:hypothetical protein
MLVRAWRFDMLKQFQLQEMFEYRDGALYNKHTRGPLAVKNTVAGSLNKITGYWNLTVKGKRCQLSRAIWVYHNGDIPKGLYIDHINRNPLDNRIKNLRLCTPTQNEYNKPRKGYCFEAGKWRAKIKINGKNKHLGMFDTEKEAKAAYNLSAQLIHGEYKHEVRI